MTVTQHNPSTTDAEFERFFAQRSDAAVAYVNGDGAPLDALVTRGTDATFHSPRGDTVSGADAVARRYLADANGFEPGGGSHFEVLHKVVNGDLAFWTGFQVASVRLKDRPDLVDMRIRVTEVFRRIDGQWKLIHRHGDMAAK